MATPQVLSKNGAGSASPTTAVTGFGVEFRPFLHSQLWEERGGMRLSILSALARLDLDPWEEAAALAQLPSEAASRRLSDLLRRLPGAPPGAIGCEPIIKRALGLLPACGGFPAAGASDVPASPKFKSKWRLIIDLVFIGSLLASFAMLVAQVSHGRDGAVPPQAPLQHAATR